MKTSFAIAVALFIGTFASSALADDGAIIDLTLDADAMNVSAADRATLSEDVCQVEADARGMKVASAQYRFVPTSGTAPSKSLVTCTLRNEAQIVAMDDAASTVSFDGF